MTRAVHLHLQRREVDLAQPLVSARGSWSRRRLLHLKIVGPDGVEGEGEASPLPGYSLDDFSDVERALAAVELSGLLEERSVDSIAAGVAQAIPARLPAARHGLECALMDRRARLAGEPLWRMLRRWIDGNESSVVAPEQAHPALPLCAILPAEPELALQRATTLMASGVKTFKVKLGPDVLRTNQRQTLRRLRARFGAELVLRLDANASLEPASLLATLRELEELQPELIEEPSAETTPELAGISPCPLALDESLAPLSTDQRVRRVRAARWGAVVLKPTALGGLAACASLAREARRVGVDAIVSHALEGPLGWLSCAHLAWALGGRRAAGLFPMQHQRLDTGVVIRAGRLLAPVASGLLR